MEDIAREVEALALTVSPVSTRLQAQADDPADREDSATRLAYGIGGRRPWGRGLRAAFYAELPPTPLGRVTRDEAQLYLDAVIRVREMAGRWSEREREKLRVIQRRWERRVRGEDRRFNALGGVFVGKKAPAREMDRWEKLDALRREMGV